MSKSKSKSVDLAITLAKTRLEQLREQINKRFEEAVESKSRAEALAEYLEQLGTGNGLKSVGEKIYEKMVKHINDNNEAISDTKAMLAKVSELEELIAILEGGEK